MSFEQSTLYPLLRESRNAKARQLVKVFSTVNFCRSRAFDSDFCTSRRRLTLDPFPDPAPKGSVWTNGCVSAVVSCCLQELMTSHENYQAPFDIDAEPIDPELDAAADAWIDGELSSDEVRSDIAADSDETNASTAEPGATELSNPFVGQWRELISRTNWEKGRIISQWREALIASGAPSTQYSDETWAQQVGGVTAPHVGRLRRVFDQFGATCESYPKLSWTHFLVAMDWDDAPMWLQGASDGDWSVSGMRSQRWETIGGADDEPNDRDMITNDLDEDFVNVGEEKNGLGAPAYTQPAQGGGSTKKYDEEPGGISSGPSGEGRDFGDEDSLNALPSALVSTPADLGDDAPDPGVLVQPFAGLPALPEDLADAIELLKLAVVRHKATGWSAVEVDTVRSYLSAFLILLDARSR